MRKLLSLMLLTVFVLGFTSCKSDDDGPSEPPFSIVGSWKVTGKLINGTAQNISGECVYNGRMSFINGGVFTEDLYTEDEETPCHLDQTIGGNWEKNGDVYTVTIATEGVQSILPPVFTAVTNENHNEFRISETSLGTTTTLIFSKL